MNKTFTFLFSLIFCSLAFCQEDEPDLLSLLEEEVTVDYASAAFKTNRVINLHSIENTAGGVLDFKISHRFGFLNGGLYELFGLDNASIRVGLDYGVTDNLTVGLGRSSFEKTFDGFLKYRFLRQSTGKRNMPVTVAALTSMAIKTLKWPNPERDNHFSSRLYYTYQLIIGRKFNKAFSMQLSPTMIHRNLIATAAESHNVFALGAAARIKISKRMAINAEYIYAFPGQLADDYKNSLSIGLDLETGGHVFQLHFTNSTSMIEKGYITESVGNWFDGDIHFGFNVSRVFTVVKPKIKE